MYRIFPYYPVDDSPSSGVYSTGTASRNESHSVDGKTGHNKYAESYVALIKSVELRSKLGKYSIKIQVQIPFE